MVGTVQEGAIDSMTCHVDSYGRVYSVDSCYNYEEENKFKLVHSALMSTMR